MPLLDFLEGESNSFGDLLDVKDLYEQAMVRALVNVNSGCGSTLTDGLRLMKISTGTV